MSGWSDPTAPPVAGHIYYPHPDTKPEHFQQPDVLELLLPYRRKCRLGMELTLGNSGGPTGLSDPLPT